MELTYGVLRAHTLENKSDSIGKPYRVMGRVCCTTMSPIERMCMARRVLTWQEEHLALFDPDILELIPVHNAEQHATLVLVEPFLRESVSLR